MFRFSMFAAAQSGHSRCPCLPDLCVAEKSSRGNVLPQFVAVQVSIAYFSFSVLFPFSMFAAAQSGHSRCPCLPDLCLAEKSSRGNVLPQFVAVQVSNPRAQARSVHDSPATSWLSSSKQAECSPPSRCTLLLTFASHPKNYR